MLMSCLSEASRSVLTQSLLSGALIVSVSVQLKGDSGTKLSVMEGLYLMSPACALATLLAVSLFETNALSMKVVNYGASTSRH